MSNKNEIAILQKDITDVVNSSLSRLQDDGLTLPPNYNASNALKSAFFNIQKVKDRNDRPALEVCTKDSIANSLLDMVVQGLSPAKTQCYFIVYGNELQMSRSYFGTQAVIKRLSNVKDIWANVIYKDDDFVYVIDKGREILVKHETSFLNRDKEILGAYAVIQNMDDDLLVTPMTRKEIETSWSQSKTKQAVHKKFPQEMAKRTVINRAAKSFINTSDDSDLLIDSVNRTTENEYDNERKDVTPEQEAQLEIEEKANTEIIDVDPDPEPSESVDKDTGEIIEEQPKKEQSKQELNASDIAKEMEQKEQEQTDLGLGF